jgi:hypothetical protein
MIKNLTKPTGHHDGCECDDCYHVTYNNIAIAISIETHPEMIALTARHKKEREELCKTLHARIVE